MHDALRPERMVIRYWNPVYDFMDRTELTSLANLYIRTTERCSVI